MVSVGTLSDAPEFATRLVVRRRTLQSSPADGFVQRRQAQSSVNANNDRAEVRRWLLVWTHATETVHDNVLGLWNDSYGGSAEITWTPIDEGSAISCRIVTQPRTVRKNAATYGISLELEESH